MSLNKSRGFLYSLSRLLGDVNAVNKGRAGRRIARRATGRMAGKGPGEAVSAVVSEWSLCSP